MAYPHKSFTIKAIATILVFVMFGCATEFDDFNNQLLLYAKDKSINQEEYEDLLQIIENSSDLRFQSFRKSDGQINKVELNKYIQKYLEVKGVNVNPNNIWKDNSNDSKLSKFNVNVYLENSGSMDGYVKGVTDFETAVYSLLGQFRTSSLCDSLNLNYINNEIPYSKKNALAPDIEDFISKLEPNIFEKRGGDRTSSDLSNIIDKVLSYTASANLSVLVSDFVFSIGKDSMNSQDFLNNQEIGVQIDFKSKLDSFDLAVIILKLTSNFVGTYYDKYDAPIPLSTQRPFYIFFFGSDEQINLLLEDKILERVKSGYEEKLILRSRKTFVSPSIIIPSNKITGSFLRGGLRDATIEGAGISSEGEFGFNVVADLSDLYQYHDPSYFVEADNYTLSSPDYNITIKPFNRDEFPNITGNYTHTLSLSTNRISNEVLSIEILERLPAWVYQSSSDDDASIASNDDEKMKTFGLKYIVEGAFDAFYPSTDKNSLCSISITIKKEN